MSSEIPPTPAREDRAKDEGGLASVVRLLLTVFAFFLLIPPWGFLVWFYSVKIVAEYERGVIFRLGRLVGARGPGLFVILPIIDRMVKMDLRTVDDGRAEPGVHHARQRHREGERRHLLPGHRIPRTP